MCLIGGGAGGRAHRYFMEPLLAYSESLVTSGAAMVWPCTMVCTKNCTAVPTSSYTKLWRATTSLAGPWRYVAMEAGDNTRVTWL